MSKNKTKTEYQKWRSIFHKLANAAEKDPKGLINKKVI